MAPPPWPRPLYPRTTVPGEGGTLPVQPQPLLEVEVEVEVGVTTGEIPGEEEEEVWQPSSLLDRTGKQM